MNFLKEEIKDEKVSKKFFRFIKYNKIFVLFLCILLLFTFYSIFGDKGLVDRMTMQTEKKDLELQLSDENKRTDELQKEIEALQDSDKRLEEVARERFGMTKEGEEVYKIELDTTETDE